MTTGPSFEPLSKPSRNASPHRLSAALYSSRDGKVYGLGNCCRRSATADAVSLYATQAALGWKNSQAKVWPLHASIVPDRSYTAPRLPLQLLHQLLTLCPAMNLRQAARTGTYRLHTIQTPPRASDPPFPPSARSTAHSLSASARRVGP